LFGAVHGDEIPTTYVLFKLTDYLKEHPEAYRGMCVVVAPLVNPDGFLASPPQRVNSNGIDLNRNFPTKDWRKEALKRWEATTHKNKRYYPGEKPGSEDETRFQIALINRFKPHKILSLHSPLGFYDFDGPSFQLDNFGKWLEKISRATDYPLKKFGVYPGSLGNYAGLERGIFTVTLELPSSEPLLAGQFYGKFKPAVTKFMELGIAGHKLVKLSE
jgi:protein MpaA